MSHVDQKLLILMEHMISSSVLVGFVLLDRFVSFCPFHLAIVLSVFFIWPLCCLSFSFGHCAVSPFHLAIVLSLFFIWPLCCLSFSFGHCAVSLFHLAIVLSVFFIWSLCCLSFSFGHCVVFRGYWSPLWYLEVFLTIKSI
jgi:hypothetical protein